MPLPAGEVGLTDQCERFDMPVVFEDEHVQCIWQQGRSSFLLVTFAHRLAPADGTRFYGDRAAALGGLNCLGIVGKAENWYPANSLRALASATRAIRSAFPEVIMLGGSMGGYGAIKHSALFGAKTCIAITPYWSLDLKEWHASPREAEMLADQMRSWNMEYKPPMKNMGIRKPDVAGSLYLLTDMRHPLEVAHVDRIRAVHDDVRVVSFSYAEHSVLTILRKPYDILDVISFCRARDFRALARLARRLCRAYPHVRQRVFDLSLAKHPALLIDKLFPSPSLWTNTRILLHSRASQTMSHDPFIMTYHGSVLYYCFRSGKVRHGLTSEVRSIGTAVHMSLSGNKAFLHVDIGGVRSYIGVNDSDELTCDIDNGSDAETIPSFILHRTTKGFGISRHGRYFCAEERGVVHCNRAAMGPWETLTIQAAADRRMPSLPVAAP